MPEGSLARDQVAAVHTTDVLVLGAGSAGCVIAARLSEDAGTQVALIEAGPAAWRDPWIRIPAGFARLYASGKYDWRFHTEPEPGLDGRSIHWPRGKVVGGSGAVNGLVFLRGSPRDYDRWAQSGARGWGYDDVLPFFKRMETWSGEASDERGTDGPIHASEARHTSLGAAAFIAASLAMGHQRVKDFNGAWHEGAGPMQMNVKGGFRSHSGDMFLKPARGRPNLRIMPERAIQRLVFEGNRCTGAIVRGPAGLERWEARREVVLSAGAIGTPQILMLSGIGDGAHLQEMGIETRLHAPGVGPEPAGPFPAAHALPREALRHGERVLAQPDRQAAHGGALRLRPARADGDRRGGGEPVRPRAARRRGAGHAVPVRQLHRHLLRPGAGRASRLHVQRLPVPPGQPRHHHAAQRLARTTSRSSAPTTWRRRMTST